MRPAASYSDLPSLSQLIVRHAFPRPMCNSAPVRTHSLHLPVQCTTPVPLAPASRPVKPNQKEKSEKPRLINLHRKRTHQQPTDPSMHPQLDRRLHARPHATHSSSSPRRRARAWWSMNETDDTGDRHRARGREATDRRAASVRNRSNKQTGARPWTTPYRDASCTVAAYLQCSAPRLVRGRRRCRLSIAVARVCCVARRGAVGRWTRRLHGRRVHQCPSIRQGTASKLTKITEREREATGWWSDGWGDELFYLCPMASRGKNHRSRCSLPLRRCFFVLSPRLSAITPTRWMSTFWVPCPSHHPSFLPFFFSLKEKH